MKWLIALLFASIAGCVTPEALTKKYSDYWVGKPVDDAVAFFGPPESVTKLNNGNEVHVFTKKGGVRGNASAVGDSMFMNVAQQYCTMRFTVGSFKTIEGLSWEGNACQ